MGKPGVALDPVADLKRRLARGVTARARVFWTRTLRRPAKFRGVPIATVRACVHTWWVDHGLDAHPAAVGKRIAIALIEQPMAEDKLAGILVLQELLGDQLRVADLPAFARLFAGGYLADWNVVDWFSFKVLATLLEREPSRAEAARVLSTWRNGSTIWQRRASCLAFIQLAPRGEEALPGITGLVLMVCATVVWSHERFDQSAVGFLLRELSRAEPKKVEVFFRRYARLMTRECARYAVEKLPDRVALLAHHKRATTIRRG